ncbi:SRPBCC family protein [Qipengyuania sphaerica]|uniref:SRPBCC family protein n=1 Tax=Qipengyuania sphaerica TaxID=2867243 RepID=UPI001C883836|nr:SRPBCC family protein [Qipengyuania sphaerica]MBX7541738.1 SRPBCC family protein [Qipengyuania sphaerica]
MRKSAIIAATTAFLLAMPASAEVVESSEHGFTTSDSAAIAAAPRQVWMALIKPGDWWADDHSWSGDASNMSLVPSAGGCFCEKIPGQGDIPLDGSARHAVVVQAIPDKSLRLRGGLGPLQGEPAEGVLTITLEPVDGGTLVEWTYKVGGPMSFEIDMISAAVDGVMSQQLRGLQAHLGALDTDGGGEGD